MGLLQHVSVYKETIIREQSSQYLAKITQWFNVDTKMRTDIVSVMAA
jgi:hypothetical protein